VARLAERDPDRGRREDLLPGDHERLLELGLDPLGDVRRVRLVLHVLEEQGELVAAQAGGGIGGAYAPGETARGLDQELVPRRVTQAVLHDLEAGPVEEEDRGPAG